VMSDEEKEFLSCYVNCVKEECEKDDLLLLSDKGCEKHCTKVCKEKVEEEDEAYKYSFYFDKYLR